MITPMSTTGLFLMNMMQHTNERIHLALIDLVLNAISTEPESFEISRTFWQAIDFIVGACTMEAKEMENKRREDAIPDDGAGSIVILFRSSCDDSEAHMECPSLSELRRLVPKLAIQVSCFLIRLMFWRTQHLTLTLSTYHAD
jgi:hypothetical protein